MKTILKKHSFLSLLVLILLSAAIALSVMSCGEKTPDGEVKTFTLEVTGVDGTVETFTVETDKDKVGEALLEEKLIQGEDSAYGLYVTTVNGEYHKYEEDGKYWAFYINGEYAMTGVDQTDIEDGAVYALKAE